MAEYDAAAVEAKWQGRWAEAEVYRARPTPGRPKFYANVPYPYMSGYQHLGFAVPFLRAEFLSRYKRMTGHAVLFPQAFHCTGLPILGAARRVAEGEPRQVRILREMGVPESDVAAFADPLHWVEVFPRATMEDLGALGAGVDWSRSFITTSLNPPYDAFVRWQFRRLRDGGFVQIGSHPVIWCPKDAAPIGDHDRLEGEGVQPVEFTLLKFPLEDAFLVAATLRPETVYGQTNLWVDPSVEYVRAVVDGEAWVLSGHAAAVLEGQGHDVLREGAVPGRSLLGRQVVAPGIGRAIPILPGTFLDQSRGTGIVTSVPSDAPDDYVALRDLQRDADGLTALGLDPAEVRAIAPIPIIRSPGYGPLPAVEVVERMGISTQAEREKLAAAKEEVYRAGYYSGVMTEVAGELSDVPVEEAKERVKARLLESGEAATLWEPGEPVVCRCATPAIVKVVEDQWFLKYGDPEWKARAHAGIDGMVLYPETVRRQFHYTVDWLRDWACAHHQGLGTKLPWDENWVIESLSDSTVYMAYYTIAHALQGGKLRSEVDWANRLTDAFFDFVFLGRGEAAAVAAEVGTDAATVERLREEFLYWYPFELRDTGKDLVQNHMTFCVFNHAAIFPEGLWPRGFGITGYVRLGGTKMSKSKGNVWYIRAALQEWGADVVRTMVANAGDGMDDPHLDLSFAETARERLRAWHAFATGGGETTEAPTPLDAWLRSVMGGIVARSRAAMEAMEYRAALRSGFFELQAAWDWYARRVPAPSRAMRDRFVRVQTLLLAPFAPHLAEEVWASIGGEGLVVTADYPTARPEDVQPPVEAAEAFLRSSLEDAREILRVTGIAPKRVTFFVAPPWKRQVFDLASRLAEGGTTTVKAIVEGSRGQGVRAEPAEIAAYAKGIADEVSRRRPEEARALAAVDERAQLEGARGFLERALGCGVAVRQADEPGVEDPKGKARHAVPGRAAIYVE